MATISIALVDKLVGLHRAAGVARSQRRCAGCLPRQRRRSSTCSWRARPGFTLTLGLKDLRLALAAAQATDAAAVRRHRA